MDKIILKDLELFGYHGVFPEEATLGQKFLLTLEIETDLHLAGKNDNLDYSISYAQLCDHIEDIFRRNRRKLIEAVAEDILSELFTAYPAIEGIKLLLKKPNAPIPQRLAYPAVELHRRYRQAYIGLGSNLGDTENNLATARSLLESDYSLRILEASSLLDTEPWGLTNQPSFLNQVLLVKTTLSPQLLLQRLLALEESMGRVRREKWGPRIIDLDILFYEDLVLHTPDLIIPHPLVEQRAFVLKSLAEISPYFIHPVLRKNMKGLLGVLGGASEDELSSEK